MIKNDPILKAGLFAAAISFFCAAAIALPVPFEDNGKWGYREAASGETVVPAIFDAAGEFSEGLAPVMLIGKWGYLNETGNFVIEPSYAAALDFSGGSARVRLTDGRWGVIDASGTFSGASAAEVPGVMSEGLAPFEQGGKWGYRDGKGRTAIEPAFSWAGTFRDGIARVKDGLSGFINRSGKFVVSPRYEALRDFSGDRAAFMKGGRWGYLDRKGGVAVPAVFHEAKDFSEGLAAVRLNARWGYVGEDGRLALSTEYSAAGPFSEGLAGVLLSVSGENEPAWIDRQGELIYRSAGAAGEDMFIMTSTAGLFGCASGLKMMLPPEYKAVAGCSDGLCLVRKGEAYEFVDLSGRPVRQTDFDEASALDCGVYRVGRGGKYGIMSATGTVLAGPVYDSVKGSACEDPIIAYLSGEGGRLDARTGAFTLGLPEAPREAVELSTSCLKAENLLSTTDYLSLSRLCDEAELITIGMERPGCTVCRLALAELYLSSAAPGGTGAALKALGEAIRVSSSPLAYRWRADLLMSSGTPAAVRQAIGDYRRLIALEPGSAEHYKAACAAYALAGTDKGSAAVAVYYCDKALELEADADSYFNRGAIKEALGDNQGALEDMRSAIALRPGDAALRLARARFSAEIGQDYRAIFDCSKVLESDPGNAAALEERGMAYLRAGDCPKALEDMQAAGRVRPGAGYLQKLAAYSWVCEEDVYKTLGIADELLRMGNGCGGPCWPPAGYEEHLSGFYGTEAHQELLKRYSVPVPEAAAEPAAPGPADGALPGVPGKEEKTG